MLYLRSKNVTGNKAPCHIPGALTRQETVCGSTSAMPQAQQQLAATDICGVTNWNSSHLSVVNFFKELILKPLLLPNFSFQ